MPLELPSTPGIDAAKALYAALAAAAASLEDSAALNLSQKADNIATVEALNAQSDQLQASADSALSVASGIRGLLPASPPEVPAESFAPQAAIFGGKFSGVFANLIQTLENLTAQLKVLAKGK